MRTHPRAVFYFLAATATSKSHVYVDEAEDHMHLIVEEIGDRTPHHSVLAVGVSRPILPRKDAAEMLAHGRLKNNKYKNGTALHRLAAQCPPLRNLGLVPRPHWSLINSC